MTDEVETMAYTNEVPWHGLGFKIEQAKNVKEMMKLAKIDWGVEKRPLSRVLKTGTYEEIKEAYELVRATDNAHLDVVGPSYVPVQNTEAFEFFNEFVEKGSAKMETAGSLRGGKYVWGLANLGESFKLAGNDKVLGYVLVACPHQQGKSFVIKFTAIRVVCMNTLQMALRGAGGEFRMVHRKEFNKDMVEQAKETMGIAREQFAKFEELAKHLKAMKMSKQKAFETFALVYARAGEKFTMDDAPEKVLRLMDIYEKAPGADPGTGWGVLNAVTYYADHVASRTEDKRLTNAWFGKTGAQKERVLELLTA